MEAMRAALQPGRARWCPMFVFSALGPYWMVSGAPKCQLATAMAVGALAHADGNGWGPTWARSEKSKRWQEITSWAHGQIAAGNNNAVGDQQRECARRAAGLIRGSSGNALA